MPYHQRQFNPQIAFRETLEYDTQLRDQIRVIREYGNIGDKQGFRFSLDMLMSMITADVADDPYFIETMTTVEDQKLKRDEIKLVEYRINLENAVCKDLVTEPHGEPDWDYLWTKFMTILGVLQRKNLLLKQLKNIVV